MGGAAAAVAAPVVQAVTSVAETAGQVVTNIVKNPLPVIETVALTAALGPEGAALSPEAANATSAAVINYANGGTPTSAAQAALGSIAGSEAAKAVGTPISTDTVSADTQKAAISGAASGATKAALTGGSVSDIAKSAVKGGAVSAGTQEVASLAGTEKGTLSDAVLRQITGQTLSNVIGGKPSGSTYTPTAAAPTTSPTSVTTTGAGVSPGSSALAQALRTDLGAPIFGGDKDKESPKSGWNIESLRYTGGTGEA